MVKVALFLLLIFITTYIFNCKKILKKLISHDVHAIVLQILCAVHMGYIISLLSLFHYHIVYMAGVVFRSFFLSQMHAFHSTHFWLDGYSIPLFLSLTNDIPFFLPYSRVYLVV